MKQLKLFLGLAVLVLMFVQYIAPSTKAQTEEPSTTTEACHIDEFSMGRVLLFSPDEKLIITNLDEQRLGVWDVKSGKIVETFLSPSKASIASADISTDSNYIAVGFVGGEGVLWDINTGKQLHTVLQPTEHDLVVKFSPNGQYLLTYSPYDPPEAVLWDVSTGKKLYAFSKGIDFRDWLGFSPSGDYVIIQNRASFVVDVWEVSTGKKLKTFTQAFIGTISRDNKLALTLQVAQPRTAILWDIPTNKEIKIISLPFSIPNLQPQFSPDGRYFLLNSTTTAFLWAVKEGKQLYEMDGYAEFSQNGKQIILTYAPKSNDPSDVSYLKVVLLTMSTLNIATGQVTKNLSLEFPSEASLLDWDFSSNHRYLATLNEAGTLQLWNAQTGKMLYTLSC